MGDFQQFIAALNILQHGDFHARVQKAFDIYNIDHTETLSARNLQDVWNCSADPTDNLMADEEFTARRIEQLTQSNASVLSLAAFKQAYKRDPAILQALRSANFVDHLLPPPSNGPAGAGERTTL
eukprot:NODE_2389_length_792_cov_295.457604_g1661_i0.p1 GENE.NODE_2389_length_792_cov_295.457604_g1661_i0~~NODE_2389_length_792_cov_295.457604_g1661_i0.p1  ORF type:complete len:125 (-),score=29.81 NODE_2389_length_792_cov_295.457604_g1661_i0:388-762(-)